MPDKVKPKTLEEIKKEDEALTKTKGQFRKMA